MTKVTFSVNVGVWEELISTLPEISDVALSECVEAVIKKSIDLINEGVLRSTFLLKVMRELYGSMVSLIS